MSSRIQLYITDHNLVPIEDEVGDWLTIEARLNFNAPASATFTAPASPNLMAAATVPRARAVVVLDDEYFCGGPIWKAGPYAKSLDDDTDAPPGSMKVSFTDDLIWLTDRLAYPDPTNDADSQGATAFYTANTQAETEMYNLANLNAGPGALSYRQIPKLIMASAAGVGGTYKLKTRMEQLTDVLRRVALGGGGLGFRTVETGGNIEFQVYLPQDLSTELFFSFDEGNLRRFELDPEAPLTTTAIVGGDGTGASRTIIERTNATAEATWGRRERWVNQSDTADTTELQQAGDEALAEDAERIGLDATAIDTEGLRYGTDYPAGALVSVEGIPGQVLVQPIIAVTLTADSRTGVVQVQPTIGTPDMDQDQAWVERVRAIEKRLGRVERG